MGGKTIFELSGSMVSSRHSIPTEKLLPLFVELSNYGAMLAGSIQSLTSTWQWRIRHVNAADGKSRRGQHEWAADVASVELWEIHRWCLWLLNLLRSCMIYWPQPYEVIRIFDRKLRRWQFQSGFHRILCTKNPAFEHSEAKAWISSMPLENHYHISCEHGGNKRGWSLYYYLTWERQVRMSSAVYFKNCVKKAWSKEQAEGDSDALQYRVSDADRLIIRQHIVETVIHLESDQLKRFFSKLLTSYWRRFLSIRLLADCLKFMAETESAEWIPQAVGKVFSCFHNRSPVIDFLNSSRNIWHWEQLQCLKCVLL